MTGISLNPEKMTPSTIALFDLMYDGEWYDNQTLISQGAAVCAAHERAEALKNGHRVRRKALASGKTLTDEDLIDSGAKDMIRNRLMIAVRGNRMERTKTHHRMTKEASAAWVALRPHLNGTHLKAVRDDATPDDPIPAEPTPTTAAPRTRSTAHLTVLDGGAEETPTRKTRKKKEAEPLIFGGIPEADGWLSAPLTLKSRVHFRVENQEVPLGEFRAALPHGCEVAFDEGTGLYRVDCAHGTGNEVRDFIRDWCEERGYKTKSLRAEHDVRRRTLSDLDPQYLSDLCVHYANYSKGRLRKHSTTLQFHFSESDDQGQQVFEWILDAASRYDDTSGVPFGAFLSERISKWVHDLNRTKYGRILTDTELKYQRAMQDFVTEHGRKPSERELADAMGQDLTVFRKNAQVVSTLQGLRNIGTLDVAPGDGEVHLPDNEFSDDRYNDALQQSLLSQIMTTSCDVDKDARGKLSAKPNVLGWVAWYETVWGQKNKTELSNSLSTSMRNMNEYTARVETRMQARKADLLGG